MTRAELYALIWERPVVQIAQTLGITGPSLRKICYDYGIPLPPAGYWTQRAHGKAAERPPLPAPAPALLRKINATLRRMGQEPLEIAATQLDTFDLQLGEARPTSGQEAIAPRHPAAAALDRTLRTLIPAVDGFIHCEGTKQPVVTVAPASIERAVALFNTLVFAMQNAGFSMRESGYGLCIEADQEIFLPVIRETVERTSGQRLGRFCVTLSDPRPFRWAPSNRVGSWYDLRGRPVEQCIPLVVTAVVAAAAVVKRARADAAADQNRPAGKMALIERGARRQAERAFVVSMSERYSEWLRLRALHDYLRRIAPDDLGSIRMLISILNTMIDEIVDQFSIEALKDEIVQRGLFDSNTSK